MKEAVREKGGGNSANARSAVDREKTKMRERQRRSITTNIFHGLRKHGGYRLSPRADINEVLRHLACEAGWIVEPDGTTYRSPSSAAAAVSNGTNSCPLCGGGRKSATATPSCSYLGGGGDCSTTASPSRATVGHSAVRNASASGLPSLSSSSVMTAHDTFLAVYMCTEAAPKKASTSDAACSAAYGNGKGQQVYLLQDASVSNQNTPAGSP
ncbi:Beta-amylase [Handroanthus impetiginosus]|uniref:Protein BZR1 homolog n=1 Tax=Handroanthus impetiginosus TaxID=429701 RepID=A0A2G9GPV6_9LAMI|nr:Beta-amylase [Handroanthus impetiginosus]